ncbi:MAG: flagellar basal body-associated protein FliL [Epsilonproteobacteria bacterium]|nr:flagellar basal body-associated protein FliL [Campylobacterota bacterium]
MAEEKENEQEEQEGSSEKKSSNKLLMIIIIVILILVIAIGGLVAYLLLSSDEEEATTTTPPPTEKTAPAPQQRTTSTPSSVGGEAVRKLNEIGVLYPLDTFTVNLKSDSGRRYLKVTMDLELSGQELSAELDNKTAVIRDRIIRILTSKTLEEVTSRKGKDKLTQQIKDTLNAMLVDGQIKGVYFTEFVIQ